MADQKKDLETLLEDVKTIKEILQNEDAAFPRVWRALWSAAAAILVAGGLQYFVPFFRNLDFDGRMYWLWLPAFCLFFPLILVILCREISRTGKKFLGQGRIQHLLFARFVVPPAALVLIWMSSRNPAFPMEGTCLLVLSIWQAVIAQALPREFRLVPLGFLLTGLVELGMRLAGPEVILFDIALTSAAIFYGGWLFRAQDRRKAGGL